MMIVKQEMVSGVVMSCWLRANARRSECKCESERINEVKEE